MTPRISYRSGVTTGVVAPTSDVFIQGISGGFIQGLTTAFALGANHKLEKGAIVQEEGTIHVSVHPFGQPSVSTQIAALRHLLLHQKDGDLGEALEKIRKVQIPALLQSHEPLTSPPREMLH